jgi:hypothetical protein
VIASLPLTWPQALLAALLATLTVLIIFQPWPGEERT